MKILESSTNNSSEPKLNLDSQQAPQLPYMLKPRHREKLITQVGAHWMRQHNTVAVRGPSSDPDYEKLSEFVNALKDADPDVTLLSQTIWDSRKETSF